MPHQANQHMIDAIDSVALTGRQADAPSLEVTRKPKILSKMGRTVVSNEAGGSKRCPVSRDSEGHDTPDDDGKEFNIFDQLLMPTKLRPDRVSKYYQEAVDFDDIDGPSPTRRRTVSVSGKRSRVDKPSKEQFQDGSDDSDVALSVRRTVRNNHLPSTGTHTPSAAPTRTPSNARQTTQKNRRTSPVTHTPSSIMHSRTNSAVPVRGRQSGAVDLESEFDQEHVLVRKPKSKKKSTAATASKAADPPAGMEGEPLSAQALAKTVLVISASNRPEKAPVTISLSLCRSPDQLFDTLLTERGLKPEVANKVLDISATYPWDRPPHGIRKGRPEDCSRFLDTVQKAWHSRGSEFEEDEEGECKIGMMIHVDEP